ADILTGTALWVFSNNFAVDLLTTEHLLWYAAIACILIITGIVIAWLSTAFTVRRYIMKH
ncbi:MAG: hypothetical protein IKR33_07485, partial [Bacteroidales bacterium]|nr:hypothetical protein [Bacteroidales bacterium]